MQTEQQQCHKNYTLRHNGFSALPCFAFFLGLSVPSSSNLHCFKQPAVFNIPGFGLISSRMTESKPPECPEIMPVNKQWFRATGVTTTTTTTPTSAELANRFYLALWLKVRFDLDVAFWKRLIRRVQKPTICDAAWLQSFQQVVMKR